MSTFDECRICGSTYQVSGYFPSGVDIPEEMKLLDNVTDEQFAKLKKKISLQS